MHELNQHKIAALLPQRRAQSNKGSYGSVAAAAGSLAYRGAAALCVEGALRTGAGLVYLASVEPVIQLVLTRTPARQPACWGAAWRRSRLTAPPPRRSWRSGMAALRC